MPIVAPPAHTWNCSPPSGTSGVVCEGQERPGRDVRRAVRIGEIVTFSLTRIALSHPICTGISRRRLGALIAELAGPWMARVLRFQVPHAALATFYGVDRSTITRAVHEIRPRLAARGFAVPGEVGLRLHTMADVFAYASPQGVELRVDGTEVRVRHPKAGRPGRRVCRPSARCGRTRRRSPLSPMGRAAPCGWAQSGRAKRSPAWSPAAQPCGDHPTVEPPGQHIPTSVVHHAVTAAIDPRRPASGKPRRSCHPRKISLHNP